jgi:hypothetical protein
MDIAERCGRGRLSLRRPGRQTEKTAAAISRWPQHMALQ